MEIKSLKAREILDSRGQPTIEASLETGQGKFSASVPSGTSAGKYEAKTREPAEAIESIENVIGPKLKAGKEIKRQKQVDGILLALDGTKDKARLGANAVLAVSIAACRALAAEAGFALYRYIRRIFNFQFSISNQAPMIQASMTRQPGKRQARTRIFNFQSSVFKLPRPCFLMFEAGRHGQGTEIQEFMVVPEKGGFSENLTAGKRIFSVLGRILKKEKTGFRVGLEGGYTGFFSNSREVLDLLSRAAAEAGEKEVDFYLDAAASEFYRRAEYRIEGRSLSGRELAEFYKKLVSRYSISILEDPFSQDDWRSWQDFFSFRPRPDLLVVADDLTVSNPERIRQAREKCACNALILKPNQIGTVSEILEAARLAKAYGWPIVVSHRSGETLDDFIADLALGIEAEFIKSGAPKPRERMAKYNRLLEIERDIEH